MDHGTLPTVRIHSAPRPAHSTVVSSSIKIKIIFCFLGTDMRLKKQRQVTKDR